MWTHRNSEFFRRKPCFGRRRRFYGDVFTLLHFLKLGRESMRDLPP